MVVSLSVTVTVSASGSAVEKVATTEPTALVGASSVKLLVDKVVRFGKSFVPTNVIVTVSVESILVFACSPGCDGLVMPLLSVALKSYSRINDLPLGSQSNVAPREFALPLKDHRRFLVAVGEASLLLAPDVSENID